MDFSSFGLTSAICPDESATVTADSANRVSAIADTLGLIANYTQGTDANKPILTRADNKENLALSSDDLTSTTYYVHNNITVSGNLGVDSEGASTLDRLTASAGSASHSIFVQTAQDTTYVSGLSYVSSVQVRRGTARYVQLLFPASRFGTTQYANFDLQDKLVSFQGAGLTSASIIEVGSDLFNISITANATSSGTDDFFFLAFITTSAAARHEVFNATGTETVFIGRVQTRTSQSDPTYLATTTAPQYRGVNGRRALRFDGVQWMDSTSTLANIMANNAKLIYLVIRPSLLNVTQNIFRDSSGNMLYSVLNTGSSGIFYNNDGAIDGASSTISTGNLILRGRQDAGNIFSAIDNGNGYTESSPVASGNTSAMTGTLRLNHTSSGFYGDIAFIGTDNTGTPNIALETYLRQEFLTSGRLTFNPFTGKFSTALTLNAKLKEMLLNRGFPF